MLPLLLAVPFAFTLAALYALLAAPMLRQAGKGSGWRWTGAFFAGWSAGVARPVFNRFPDWTLSYLVEAQPLPRAPLYLFYAVALLGAGIAGAALTSRAVLAGRRGRAALWLAAGLALLLAALGLGLDRALHVGTALEYAQGFARGFAADREFVRAAGLASLATGVPALGLALLVALEAVRTRSRHLTSPGPAA